MKITRADTSQEPSKDLSKILIDEGVEYSVLGWIVNNLDEAEKQAVKLTPHDFTDAQPKGLISIILKELANDKMPDEIKLINIARSQKVLEKFENLDFYKSFSSKDIDWAISKLKDRSARRTLADELTREVQNVYDLDADVDSLMQRLSELPEKVVSNHRSQSKTLIDIAQEAKDLVEPPPILHGDSALDAYFAGLSIPGYVEGILGRTGHGKSRFGQGRALLYAEQGYNVQWVQLEGSRFETLHDICSIGGDGDFMKKIHVQDSFYTLSDIMREIRTLHYDIGLDVVFIDYLQEIQAEGYRPSEVRQEKSYISRSLRRLAKELGIYMIWMLQPSREDKHSKGWAKQPSLSDIIETSQIEKDCYMVSGVFRPNMVPDLVVNERVKWYDHTDLRPNLQPYDSVVIQQLKNRKSPRNKRLLHLIDSSEGMKPYLGSTRDEYDDYAGSIESKGRDNIVEGFRPEDMPPLPLLEEAPF